MKVQSIVLVGAFLVAFSAVSDALAIGFEVDTPLDPLLGGLNKMKRQIIRRVKDLGTDDSFINSSPLDQLNMLFSPPPPPPPSPPPVTFPQFTFPGQTPQQPLTTQLPMTTIEQRKVGLNQIPPNIAQAMDAQLISFLNHGLAKRGLTYPSFSGVRQVPGIMPQMTTQTVPFRGYNQCPLTQQKQGFF